MTSSLSWKTLLKDSIREIVEQLGLRRMKNNVGLEMIPSNNGKEEKMHGAKWVEWKGRAESVEKRSKWTTEEKKCLE